MHPQPWSTIGLAWPETEGCYDSANNLRITGLHRPLAAVLWQWPTLPETGPVGCVCASLCFSPALRLSLSTVIN